MSNEPFVQNAGSNLGNLFWSEARASALGSIDQSLNFSSCRVSLQSLFQFVVDNVKNVSCSSVRSKVRSDIFLSDYVLDSFGDEVLHFSSSQTWSQTFESLSDSVVDEELNLVSSSIVSESLLNSIVDESLNIVFRKNTLHSFVHCILNVSSSSVVLQSFCNDFVYKNLNCIFIQTVVANTLESFSNNLSYEVFNFCFRHTWLNSLQCFSDELVNFVSCWVSIESVLAQNILQRFSDSLLNFESDVRSTDVWIVCHMSLQSVLNSLCYKVFNFGLSHALFPSSQSSLDSLVNHAVNFSSSKVIVCSCISVDSLVNQTFDVSLSWDVRLQSIISESLSDGSLDEGINLTLVQNLVVIDPLCDNGLNVVLSQTLRILCQICSNESLHVVRSQTWVSNEITLNEIFNIRLADTWMSSSIVFNHLLNLCLLSVRKLRDYVVDCSCNGSSNVRLCHVLVAIVGKSVGNRLVDHSLDACIQGTITTSTRLDCSKGSVDCVDLVLQTFHLSSQQCLEIGILSSDGISVAVDELLLVLSKSILLCVLTRSHKTCTGKCQCKHEQVCKFSSHVVFKNL